MKTLKSGKTTESETVIEATIHVTRIVKGEVGKDAATKLLNDIFEGSDLDHIQIKDVKIFVK